LNKADLSDRDRLEMALLKGRFDEVVTLSAHTGVGLDELANRVVARRASAWTEFDVDVPHDVGRLAALVNEHGEVLSEMWDDDGWHARISVPKSVVWQLKAFKRRRVRAPL
jgi:GTP-binding protein HflX